MHTSETINELARHGSLWGGLHEIPGVFVSYEGQVASIRSGRLRFLKGIMRGRYLSVSAIKKGPYVHRVACEMFHGQAPDGCEVRHLDGNPLNNSAHNLAWGTRAENAKDKIAHGTHSSGERNGGAKLTAARVDAMRALRDVSGRSYRDIGAQFGVSTMTAFRAIRGQSWK